MLVGLLVGVLVGFLVGTLVGHAVGSLVGYEVGTNVGSEVSSSEDSCTQFKSKVYLFEHPQNYFDITTFCGQYQTYNFFSLVLSSHNVVWFT